MKTFTIKGKRVKAEDRIQGVLINPVLPEMFDQTPNEERPRSHEFWWYRTFITTCSLEDREKWLNDPENTYAEAQRKAWEEKGKAEWLAHWPSGTRYCVRCLDGGAWDRSTNWGMFGSLEEALKVARGKP